MTEKEKKRFEEWKTARWDDYKDKLPKGTTELEFLHAWLKYGLIHEYVVVMI